MGVSCYAPMSTSMLTISICNRLVGRSLVGVSPWACDYETGDSKERANLVAALRELTSSIAGLLQDVQHTTLPSPSPNYGYTHERTSRDFERNVRRSRNRIPIAT